MNDEPELEIEYPEDEELDTDLLAEDPTIELGDDEDPEEEEEGIDEDDY